MKVTTWLFFLFLALPFCSVGQQHAVVDLTDVDFNNGKILSLNQEFEFYWNKLYTPADFKNGLNGNPDLLVKPGSWNDLEVNGKKCGSYGYATYRLTLINLPDRELVLDAYSVQTACRIFINDSLKTEVGKVETDEASTEPMNRDEQIIIPAGLDTAQIIIQIANFHHRKGGFVHPFEIGTPETIVQQRLQYYLLDSIESSALAIIGLFLLALYIFRRKDLSVLYFALFCISLSARPIISVNYLVAFVIPQINWSLMLKVEYLAVFFACLFMTLYIRELFPKQLPKIIVRILATIFIVKIVITVFTPPAVFSWLVLSILVTVPIGIIILTITIIRAVIAKVEGANYAGIGVIVLFVSLLLKVLSYSGIIPPVNVLITMLDIAFIFMMSLILGSRFSIQFVKVELLQERTEQQNVEIEQKKQLVEKQKHLVEEKNKEILDSIKYAKRIQAAILPPVRIVKQFLPDSFVLYKPKDIVAGDFYWLERRNDKLLVAAADCTGHGVPGSLVSVICNNGLNRSVREHGLTDPGLILDRTRDIIISEFEKSDEEVRDGMDISLVSLKTIYEEEGPITILDWAGANNPLWIIRKNSATIEEFRPDKQPIGKYADPKPFRTHQTQLKKGDVIYLFTDGYQDQFGGPGGKKFKALQLKELLLSISGAPMTEQKKILDERFEAWRGSLEQVDDVCVIGVRVS